MRASLAGAAVVSLAALVLLGFPAEGARSEPTTCSSAEARAAILRAPLPRWTKDLVRPGSGGGVDRLICHDFTRDGRTDMAVSLFSGGTAGDIAWMVFRATPAGRQLALQRLHVYKLLLRRLGDDLVETQPIYLEGDPNCCPSGGFSHLRFHWNGERFVVVRRWEDSVSG